MAPTRSRIVSRLSKMPALALRIWAALVLGLVFLGPSVAAPTYELTLVAFHDASWDERGRLVSLIGTVAPSSSFATTDHGFKVVFQRQLDMGAQARSEMLRLVDRTILERADMAYRHTLLVYYGAVGLLALGLALVVWCYSVARGFRI